MPYIAFTLLVFQFDRSLLNDDALLNIQDVEVTRQVFQRDKSLLNKAVEATVEANMPYIAVN